jgi:peptidoglycan hydrolase CwlO-like protein
MDNNRENSRTTPDDERAAGESAAQKAVPVSHFRRSLVPLDEYASRQGISSDIVEKQGQLGVIQIRKFKGQKFVVDVPVDQLSEFENEQSPETEIVAAKPRVTAVSRMFTAGLTAGLIIIIVSVFWLYMDAKQKLDDVRADYTVLQNRYNDLTATNQQIKAMQEELAGSKVEFARIQNRIATSKAELEKIQADLNKARQNLDAVQSELSGVQGQISLSRVEIEGVQNGLNDSKKELDTLHRQNAEVSTK